MKGQSRKQKSAINSKFVHDLFTGPLQAPIELFVDRFVMQLETLQDEGHNLETALGIVKTSLRDSNNLIVSELEGDINAVLIPPKSNQTKKFNA